MKLNLFVKLEFNFAGTVLRLNEGKLLKPQLSNKRPPILQVVKLILHSDFGYCAARKSIANFVLFYNWQKKLLSITLDIFPELYVCFAPKISYIYIYIKIFINNFEKAFCLYALFSVFIIH